MSDHTPSQQQRNGEQVLYCFNDNAITYGSRVNANDLKFDIVLEADKVVRLINPSSDPRLSWQRIRNHCHIDWGDGHVTKWYARVINSGRFNRNSEFIPQHEYKNANVGDRFTITVKCREPLVPIYCRLEKMWGEFPEDIYRVKSNPEADDDCGLFGECYHRDYPELSLLNKHRGTVHTMGPDLLVNWRNTDMTNMFSYFIALREVPVGLFRTVMGNVLSYESCFKGCDSLETVDAGLLGLSNNVVRVLDSMFESCISLKNTIYLQNSESLISVKSMYKDCLKLNLCDERLLNYCTNIIHADRIFMNDKMLNTLGPNVLKFSLNMETISEACRNTGMTQTYISIGKMSKLYYAERMYYDCMKLATITEGFFQNTGINASKELNIDRIFMRAGDRTNGCVVPSKLCQPLSNVRLKTKNSMWFFNFAWRGNDFPADLFRDTFKSGPNRNNLEIHDLIAFSRFPQAAGIEMYNKIFSGNQEGLTVAYHLYAGVGTKSDYDYGPNGYEGGSGSTTPVESMTPITYFNRDMLENLVNLTNVYRIFGHVLIHFKFYEDIFKNNTKIQSFGRAFYQSRYKFNKFPIDYIIRTTSDYDSINAAEMYSDSNIRVYRPIHWSATRNARYNLRNIVSGNLERPSVPIEFMLDGRTPTDPDYSFEYFPRGLEYIFQANNMNNDRITLCMTEKVSTADENYTPSPCDIDWGDGIKEHWAPSSNVDEKTHAYSGNGCYKITIRSDKTAYFVKQTDNPSQMSSLYPILEIRGEYPYGSFDVLNSFVNGHITLMNTFFIDQSVYRICHTSGDTFRCAAFWTFGSLILHPYLLKYCSNLSDSIRFLNIERIPTKKWGVSDSKNNLFTYLECIPPRFYENCVSLKKWNGSINSSSHMIPDDIYPKTLIVSHNSDDPISMAMIGGSNSGNHHNCNKFHLKTSMYRDWMLEGINDREESDLFMSYPVLPYKTSWIQQLPHSSPLYEKLIFVVRDITINELGLERLISNTSPIGEIRIEIFTDSGIIDKTISINSDTDLVNCIGNISGELNVINIYSKVPLWLNNHNIINEVRGVIPECNLNKVFKDLAPNVTRIGEELFYRLTNTSFDNMFKDCSKLEQVPQRLFLCNTKAKSFVSCFENCVSLDRIPDYLLLCYDHDIDCTSMFKGCTGIKYIFRPICDSVLGRVTVTDMLKGCKSTAYDLSKSFDEQVMTGIWHKGIPGLTKADLTSTWQRATLDVPTMFIFHYHNSLVSAENQSVKINKVVSVDLENIGASIYVYDLLNWFDKDTVIEDPIGLGKAIGYRLDSIFFNNPEAISMNDFCDVTRYAYKLQSLQFTQKIEKVNGVIRPVFKDEKLIPNKNFLFWADWLIDTYRLFAFTTLYTPFHSSFMKMCERIGVINQIFNGTHFKHINDIEVESALGRGHSADIYLGAQSRTESINFDVVLDRNIECVRLSNYAFNWVKGNFNGDKLCLGEFQPSECIGMFGSKLPNDDTTLYDVARSYPLTMYTIKNMCSNSNFGRFGKYHPKLNWGYFLELNNKIISDNGLMKKMCSFTNALTTDKDGNNYESIRGQYSLSSLSEIKNDCFTTLLINEPVELYEVFAGSKIKIMPKINHLLALRSAGRLFNKVKTFENPIIPENYIKSDYQKTEVLLESMFAFSNARVENQFIDITSTATFDPIASLEDCISTIGDDPEIFLGIKYNKDPAHHSRVNFTGEVKDAFKQIIVTESQNISVHIDYVGDHTTSLKNVSGMVISWGDDSVNNYYDGQIDFATLRHEYSKPGEYIVQIRCREFMAYVDTSIDDVLGVKTKFVGQFKTGDAREVLSNENEQLGLTAYFGHYVEEFEDNLFENLSNCEEITVLKDVFSSFPNLKRIPADVYKPFINVIEIERDFYGDTSISAIPEDLYKHNTKLTSMCENFVNTSISSIPKNIFVNNSEITTINGMFKSTNLKAEGVPIDLLKPLSKLSVIIDPWSDCNNMIYEDDERWNNILKYNTNLVHIYGICAGGHLNSIPRDIISTLNNLETAELFYTEESSSAMRDPDIDMIPVELFTRNPNLKSVDKCFKYRYNIKGVSSDIFKNNPRLNSFKMTFANSGLKEIPKYIINDTQQEEFIDCTMMFSECVDVTPMENEPISQHATRRVTTNLMLNNVRSMYCEPEIFNGVHANAKEYNSGYVWDCIPILYSLYFYASPSQSLRLYPLFQRYVDRFEPVYVERIELLNASYEDSQICTSVLNKTFNTLEELNSYIIEISPGLNLNTRNYLHVRIYANKPLILEYEQARTDVWVGVHNFIPKVKNFNQDDYAMDQFLSPKDRKYAWPHEFLTNYYNNNDKKNKRSK